MRTRVHPCSHIHASHVLSQLMFHSLNHFALCVFSMCCSSLYSLTVFRVPEHCAVGFVVMLGNLLTVCAQLPLAFAGMMNLHFGSAVSTPAVGQ